MEIAFILLSLEYHQSIDATLLWTKEVLIYPNSCKFIQFIRPTIALMESVKGFYISIWLLLMAYN